MTSITVEIIPDDVFAEAERVAAMVVSMTDRHRAYPIASAILAERRRGLAAAETVERLPEWWQVWDEENQEWVIGSSGQIAMSDGLRMRPLYAGPEATT